MLFAAVRIVVRVAHGLREKSRKELEQREYRISKAKEVQNISHSKEAPTRGLLGSEFPCLLVAPDIHSHHRAISGLAQSKNTEYGSNLSRGNSHCFIPVRPDWRTEGVRRRPFLWLQLQ